MTDRGGTVEMHPDVARHLTDIQALCREFGVQRMEIFGSAVTDEFDPERSDVDFIVTYPEGYDFGSWGGRVMELEEQLSIILQRDVDVVFNKPFRNRFFAREVERTRQDIYDASRDTEVA
jgi:uncharacterized protein